VSESTSSPPLSVHELSQYKYCPRAGLLAFEAPLNEAGEDWPRVRLSYLPKYNLAEIERWISNATLVLIGSVGLAAIALGWVFLASMFGSGKTDVYGWLAFGVLFLASAADLVVIMLLVRRRREALGTPAREPEFVGDEPISIHWWELRAAGYQPRSPSKIDDDELLNVHGKPWLVMVRGNQWIPVIRMRGASSTVHANHILRLAAYRYLIETSTHYECPFGLLLLPNSLEARAVSKPALSKAELQTVAADFRQLIDSRRTPAPPAKQSICDKCFFGLPHRYVVDKSETYSEGQPLPPLTVKVAGKYWHSKCGDRFRWHTPPTRKYADLPEPS
jgi:hypothetical protein